MTVVVVEAPAKVNLSLHVVGRRDDGYHLLDSLIAFAGVGDTLTAAPAEDLALHVDGPFAEALAAALPAGAENIVLKAARRLAEAAGIAPRARLTLTKRLPVAAGIGGGSADAAAALLALCRLWDVAPPREDLMALALGLGADVPVCLQGRAANVSGVGEGIIDAPTLPPAWLVLVNPLVAVSTPEVFRARRGRFNQAAPLTEAPADAAALAEALRARANDLTKAAVTLAPEIGTVLVDIGALPGCLLARMSGSGATCFGLFAAEAEARAAAAALAQTRPEWWSAAAPLLSDRPR
ncbi:4-(cytidine 5'-diphospho)-2-C-methyl-D-erythritol kinase [Caenispirillum bisanense]|uniref:4-diphosphocytidyl-2-C-methyl-D-erythritol kinase n=1 Tax=Caenispirillum bisanense TaxID=414052 RepID=A0A286GM76_9PROT|nr:4-(cytidine 5'-diphospho)-2-C-methyl-D-erythritol kinase [Caenispirillum bisanense]SOD96094.1 4-diphosphocytidyl-2-C-methyl-D-erythritol kinase [Caenispirillum bisanense]